MEEDTPDFSSKIWQFSHEYQDKDLKEDAYDKKSAYKHRYVESLQEYEEQHPWKAIIEFGRDSLSFEPFKIQPLIEKQYQGIEFLTPHFAS